MVLLESSFGEFSQRLFKQAQDDDVTGMAAELAFRSLLALFPFFLVVATVGAWLTGLFGVDDPTAEVLDLVSDHLPADAASVVSTQVGEVVDSSNLGLFSIGMLGAIWAASGSVNALIKAVNRTYNVKETRPLWERYALSLGTTMVTSIIIIASLIVMFGGQIVGSELAEDIGLEGLFAELASLARLPLVFIALCAAVTLVYRIAPNRDVTWRGVFPGAVVFAVLWVVGTLLFAIYVANFGSYNATYGALGGAIVLLLWLYLSSAVLLIGAEVNAVLEAMWADRAESDSV